MSFYGRRKLLAGFFGGSCGSYAYLTREFEVKTGGDLGLRLSNWRLAAYLLLPLDSLSRTAGTLSRLNIPESLRSPIFSLYSSVFGVNLFEIENQDLTSFKSFQSFFTRKIDLNYRPISESSDLVSPCDGRVLHVGPLNSHKLSPIKGVAYHPTSFMGGRTIPELSCSENRLYQCVLYLAPGDYHRFHSPTDWSVSDRRHVQGHLFSVNPSVLKWSEAMLNLNERAIYSGDWKYGFFSMTAVGATNVGNITVNIDKSLETNLKGKTEGTHGDYVWKNKVICSKGMEFGTFHLGSTIVLIFEAPLGCSFCVQDGEVIKMGEPLFHLKKGQ